MSENYQVLLPGLPGFGLGGPSQLVQVCSHLAFSKKLKAIGALFSQEEDLRRPGGRAEGEQGTGSRLEEVRALLKRQTHFKPLLHQHNPICRCVRTEEAIISQIDGL